MRKKRNPVSPVADAKADICLSVNRLPHSRCRRLVNPLKLGVLRAAALAPLRKLAVLDNDRVVLDCEWHYVQAVVEIVVSAGFGSFLPMT